MFPINRFPRQVLATKWSRTEDDIEHGKGRRNTLPDITSGTESKPTTPAPIFLSGLSAPVKNQIGANSDERPSDPDAINSAVEQIRPRASRDESTEGQPRRRFISNVYKKEYQRSEESFPRRRPWYQGKALKHQPFTVRNQLLRTVFNSWLNMLLLLVPVGFVLNYIHANPIAVFFVNFVAILPMAGMLGYAMDELRLHTGDVLGALVYMTFGNVVQSITCIFLLRSRQISTLKTSLVGGILTMILLNNGVAFFFGGLRRDRQYYNTTIATTFNGLLSVSVAAFVIPTASYYLSATAIPVITKQSRGMAFILMAIYGLYLFFELKTHAVAFSEESQKVPQRPRKSKLPQAAIAKGLAKAGGVGAGIGRSRPENSGCDELITIDAYELEEEPEDPQLHFYVCILTLVVGTTILAFNTQFMTDSIQGLTEKAGVPRDFIGLVLLPILSNDAMAIQCAVKDQMDLAINSSLGKSLQTALVVTPILVVVGWGMRIEDMNLLFDGFQVASLFVSILLAQQCILDGTSNWLKGAILTLTYVIIAIASWYQGTQSVLANTA